MSGPGAAWLFAQLVALAVATSPLGHLVTRALERAGAWPRGLRLLERAVLAPMMGGAVAYLLAYLPGGLYSGPILAVLFGAAAPLAALDLRRHRRVVRTAIRSEGPVALGPLGIAAAFLLGYCLLRAPVGFANTFDGSVQADFVVVLLSTHHAAWQLAPFASGFGVIYPQGTAVWLGLPALAFGWSPVSAAVGLTPLFLALSVVGASAWATAWVSDDPARARRWGWASAGFFAAVATWPRLVIFGSYDFAFGLPLLFVWLSVLGPTWPGGPTPRGWVGMGVLLAVIASLSAAVAEFAALWLLASALWRLRPLRSGALRGLARALGTIALGLCGVLPSLAGAAAWWSYPSHVLTVVGPGGAYVPAAGSGLSLGVVLADLDPFVPFGAKLAPGPILWVVSVTVLTAGLALALYRLVGDGPPGPGTEKAMARHSLGLAGLAALLTAVLLASAAGTVAGVGAFASLGESSLLLFLTLELVALGAVLWLIDHAAGTSADRPGARGGPRPWSRGAPRAERAALAAAALLLLFGAGLGGSVAEISPYAATLDHSLANVTASDVQALQWAATHLRPSDRVLVAPGSAAQYLPVYSAAPLVFPMNPAPADRDYWQVAGALQAGTVNATVRAEMGQLGITVVFVTGASTVLWAPFDPAPLLADPAAFPVLFHSGDAYLFGVDGAFP